MRSRFGSICVYCGAGMGASPVYADAARSLARTLAANGISLVYGGANLGLMGVIADELMRLGGEVIGVIPRALMEREVGHGGLTRLHVVDDMHERKAMMADLADGFIAMPGGLGTLEELFEMLTWAQLGFHGKPIGVLNANRFYDGLASLLDHIVKERFLRMEDASRLIFEEDPDLLVGRLQAGRLDAGTGFASA
jgi:uncharacterized protein (TIGR00730 family)